MKKLPPIIAAVDFSSSSFQVLAHAAKIAAASGQPLLAVHVIGTSRLKHWEDTVGTEATTAMWVEEETQRLAELAADACGDVPVRITVRIGRPYQTLSDVVTEEGADLLVLGAHDVSKRRLGAVAGHCARSIPTDVLILRDWQGQAIRRIAACVDFSPSSAAGLARAIELAKVHRASVEIIHVMFPPARDPWGRVLEQRLDDEVSYETHVRERARSRLDAFLEPFRERLAGIDSSVTFLEGESPAAAIAAHVELGNIDLTVTGSHAESWVEDFVLGSNAESLLHDSTSSVLIARSRAA